MNTQHHLNRGKQLLELTKALLSVTMSFLSPSANFSPTLARQAIATTKDWNYVDAWLSRQFSPGSAPPFERNAETLKALLALAAVNEAADEERDLLSNAEAKALTELRQHEPSGPQAELLGSLEDNLTKSGKESLEALAETATVLNLPFADTEEMARRVVDLQVNSFNIAQASSCVSILHDHLESESELASKMLEEFEGEEYRASSDVTKQTAEYQRKAKLLVNKLPELTERIAALQNSENTGPVQTSIQDIDAEEKRFKAALAMVKDLEVQVKSYHGLPHDTDLARQELERLRDELQKLTKQRDGMFEGLVERESPAKRTSRR